MQRFFLLFLFSPTLWAVCNQTLSPGASISDAVNSASSGDTICLTSGNYGDITLNGLSKAGFVTVTSSSGVSATLSTLTVNNGTQFVKFDHLTIGSIDVWGQSTNKHLHFTNNVHTGIFKINTLDFNQNDILISNSTFNGIDATSSVEGRLQIGQYPSQTNVVGVTVTGNYFGGFGCSDGIQVGSYGVVISNNTFKDLEQGSCNPSLAHVDSLQLYGASHTVIDSNYFERVNVCIGAYDGGNTETITNNVAIASGGANNCVVYLTSMPDLNLQHNTFVSSSILIGAGNIASGVTGVIKNNVFDNCSYSDANGYSFTGTTTNNLFSASNLVRGTNAIVGLPYYVGPVTAWNGYKLDSISPGFLAGDDGLSVGIYTIDPAIVQASGLFLTSNTLTPTQVNSFITGNVPDVVGNNLFSVMNDWYSRFDLIYKLDHKGTTLPFVKTDMQALQSTVDSATTETQLYDAFLPFATGYGYFVQ